MRRRLVVAIAGVATTAVILLALPLGVALERTFRDEELLKLQRDAVATTRSIDLNGSRTDPIELPEAADQLSVYDRAGRLLGGDGPATPSPLLDTALREGRLIADSSDGRLAVAVPLLEAERTMGVLLVERDDAVVDRRERKAWLALGGLALGIVALAVGAALLTARRLARPLERLADAAGNVDRRELIEGTPPAGIAELDAVATALSESARRLDETLARERAFSSDASHQLRTPLAALRIELESIELEQQPPEQIGAALEQVDRLQQTIDTLLSVVRDGPRTGRAADLVATADRIERARHAKLAAAGRPIRVRADSGQVVAAADPAVVEQILSVLVDNADLHGAGAVTIGVREAVGWVAVDIGDEGQGFGPDPERSFDRRHSDGGGHGIGLSLARSLAEAEGGSLLIAAPGPSPVLTLLLPPLESGPAGGPAVAKAENDPR